MRGRKRVSTGSPYEPRKEFPAPSVSGMLLSSQGLLRSGRMVRLLGAAIPRHKLAEALKLFVRPFEGWCRSVGRDTHTDSADSHSRLGAGGANPWGILW